MKLSLLAKRRARTVMMFFVFSAVLSLSSQAGFSQTENKQLLPTDPEDSGQDLADEHIDVRLPQGFHNVFVTVGSQRIHFVIGGSGKPLLLLHGFPTTWYEWSGIMPQLAANYTVIAADLPGSGDSDAPSCCYDKKTMANQFYVALQRLGYPKISIVGHDIGGMVAYAYAAQHPEAVNRLAIMDVPLPSPAYFTLPAFSPDGDTSYWHFGFLNVERLPEQLIRDRERIFVNYFIRHLAADPTGFPNRNISIYAQYLALPGRKHGAFGWYRAFRQDIQDNAQLSKDKLSIPVLAIGGDHTAGAMEAESLVPFFENVTSAVIADSGHWIPEEQPDALISLIRSFFPD